MGWFDGGGGLFLPEMGLRRDQNTMGFVLWSDLERVSCHFLSVGLLLRRFGR